MHSCRICPSEYLSCSKLQRHIMKRHMPKPSPPQPSEQWPSEVSCILCNHQSKTLVEVQVHLLETHVQDSRVSRRSESQSLLNTTNQKEDKENKVEDPESLDIDEELDKIDPDIAFQEDEPIDLSLALQHEIILEDNFDFFEYEDGPKHLPDCQEEENLPKTRVEVIKSPKKKTRKRKPKAKPDETPKMQVKRVKCPECSKEVKKYYLKHHVNTVHAKENNFMCSQCPETFRTKAALTNHSKHHDGPQFLCPHCPKTFTLESTLNNHIKVFHSEDRSFQCPHCPKKFAIDFRLKNHINVVHKKVKQLRCWLCSHHIYDIKELAEHVKEKHEGAVRFQCAECPWGFLSKNSYDSHVKAVHRQLKEFKCYYCPREFGWSSSRFKHMFSAHGHTKETPKPL